MPFADNLLSRWFAPSADKKPRRADPPSRPSGWLSEPGWIQAAGEKFRLNQTRVLKTADQRLMVSGASFGLAVSGILLHAPAASLASIPLVLYTFVPIFKQAGHSLRKTQKINEPVLIATRVAVSVSMGYTLIASLDALLQATSQRAFIRNRETLQQSLQKLAENHPASPARAMQSALAHPSPDQFQLTSARHAERFVPWMLVSFAAFIPLIGLQRAAAFLTTAFGTRMYHLGPYTTQRFMLQAMRQNVWLMQPDALRRVGQMKTLVIDASLSKTPAWRAHNAAVLDELEQRGLQIWCSDALPDAVRDALQNEPFCHISHCGADRWSDTALTIGYHDGQNTEAALHTDILITGDDLAALPRLFKLAELYTKGQKFNQIAPDVCDVIDIGTTLLLRLGLLYSILFAYTGLLLGTIKTKQLLEHEPLPDDDA